MRFRGQEYTGKGQLIAIVDSGVNPADPRLAGVEITGLTLTMYANQHVLVSGEFQDEAGHGTEVAAAIHQLAPDAKLLCIRIMDKRMMTTADLMAAGIEMATRQGAHVINLSLGTINMGKALLLRECVAAAVENNSVVLGAAHPKGDRAYPADLPETLGVASHPDCPIDKFYFYSPHRFPSSKWGHISGKFLTHGASTANGRTPGVYRGPSMATAYLAGRVACLREAMPDARPDQVISTLQQLALTPAPEIGYS